MPSRGVENGEKRMRNGGENDIYYRPLCHEYHCGVGRLTPCVGATRIRNRGREDCGRGEKARKRKKERRAGQSGATEGRGC